MRKEIRSERRVARLCVLVGIAVALLAFLLPPPLVVLAGMLGSGAASLRCLAVVGDSADKEGRLELGSVSPAEECSCIKRWARRVATLPGRSAQYLARVATAPAPAGKLTRLRALPVALPIASLAVFLAIGTAIGAEKIVEKPGEPPVADAASGPPPAPGPPVGNPFSDSVDEVPTYAQSCPELPDPAAIGHEMGELFRYDGAFKAGCGTEARQVAGTGVWFAAGVCAGQLRSVAVARDGEAALLYGAAARFAWRAALGGELVGAEAAYPAGADVFVVTTSSGSYGFVRKASSDGSGGRVRDCTDVTGTARPFAELPPPMMLHWRNLVERRAAWSWPLREDAAGDALVFDAYPGGAVTARGACASELSCYLDVDGIRWPGDETAYVSLDELAPYMPPPAP
jgi:hypothetical protein